MTAPPGTMQTQWSPPRPVALGDARRGDERLRRHRLHTARLRRARPERTRLAARVEGDRLRRTRREGAWPRGTRLRGGRFEGARLRGLRLEGGPALRRSRRSAAVVRFEGLFEIGITLEERRLTPNDRDVVGVVLRGGLHHALGRGRSGGRHGSGSRSGRHGRHHRGGRRSGGGHERHHRRAGRGVRRHGRYDSRRCRLGTMCPVTYAVEKGFELPDHLRLVHAVPPCSFTTASPQAMPEASQSPRRRQAASLPTKKRATRSSRDSWACET